MKFLATLLVGAFLVATGGAAFAAGMTGHSLDGTWVMNADKSKFSGPAFKSQTRTYSEAADGTVTMALKGVASDGSAVSGGSTFKYDGKDYPITGSGDYDTLSGKKVNGTTIKFSLKKSGKVVGTGTRTLSAHGKVLTLTSKIFANGSSYTSTIVFDKQ